MITIKEKVIEEDGREIFYVSSNTVPSKLAFSIYKTIQHKPVSLRAIGIECVSRAVKSIIKLRDYLAPDGSCPVFSIFGYKTDVETGMDRKIEYKAQQFDIECIKLSNYNKLFYENELACFRVSSGSPGASVGSAAVKAIKGIGSTKKSVHFSSVGKQSVNTSCISIINMSKFLAENGEKPLASPTYNDQLITNKTNGKEEYTKAIKIDMAIVPISFKGE